MGHKFISVLIRHNSIETQSSVQKWRSNNGDVSSAICLYFLATRIRVNADVNIYGERRENKPMACASLGKIIFSTTHLTFKGGRGGPRAHLKWQKCVWTLDGKGNAKNQNMNYGWVGDVNWTYKSLQMTMGRLCWSRVVLQPPKKLVLIKNYCIYLRQAYFITFAVCIILELDLWLHF